MMSDLSPLENACLCIAVECSDPNIAILSAGSQVETGVTHVTLKDLQEQFSIAKDKNYVEYRRIMLKYKSQAKQRIRG